MKPRTVIRTCMRGLAVTALAAGTAVGVVALRPAAPAAETTATSIADPDPFHLMDEETWDKVSEMQEFALLPGHNTYPLYVVPQGGRIPTAGEVADHWLKRVSPDSPTAKLLGMDRADWRAKVKAHGMTVEFIDEQVNGAFEEFHRTREHMVQQVTEETFRLALMSPGEERDRAVENARRSLRDSADRPARQALWAGWRLAAGEVGVARESVGLYRPLWTKPAYEMTLDQWRSNVGIPPERRPLPDVPDQPHPKQYGEKS